MKARSKIIAASIAILIFAGVSILPWAWSRIQPAPPAHDWNAHAIAHIQPVELSNDVEFAVMGDSRGGQQVFRQVLTGVATQRPAFAIHMGDFVAHGKVSEYAEFIRVLKDFSVPLPTVIGNHEVIGGGRTRYEDIFGAPYYSFSVGRCLFVVVDDASAKDIGQEQMQWLRTQLRRPFAHKFVFLHVPPFDPRASESETETEDQPEHCLDSQASAEEFMRTVREGHVDIVFASHIHGYFDVVRDGVRYIISGGAGAKLHGRDQVHGEEVRVDVRRVSISRLDAPGSQSTRLGNASIPTTGQETSGRDDR